MSSGEPKFLDNSGKIAVVILLGAAVIRFMFSLRIGVIPDEAYYWTWANRIEACYWDQPAGIALLDAVFKFLLGTSKLAVRTGAAVCGALGGIVAFATARRIYGTGSAGIKALIFALTIPLFVSGAILMLHDTVSALFVSGFIYAFSRALFEPDDRWFFPAAVLLALAIYGKLSAFLFLPGIAIALLALPEGRSALKRYPIYLSAFLGVGMLAPILLWNARHGFVTFWQIHKLSMVGVKNAGVSTFIELLGGQTALISPILVALFIWFGAASLFNIRHSENRRHFMLAALAMPMFFYFIVMSIFTRVQGNWPGPSYYPLAILAAGYWDKTEGSRKLNILFIAGTILAALMTATFIVQAAFRIIPLQPEYDPTSQSAGWEQAASNVLDTLRMHPDAAAVVSRRYQVASEMTFHLPGNPYALTFGGSIGRGSQSDLWADWTSLAGKNLLYIDPQMPPGVFAAHCKKLEQLQPAERTRNGRHVEFLRQFICREFNPSQGPVADYFSNPMQNSLDHIKKYIRMRGREAG